MAEITMLRQLKIINMSLTMSDNQRNSQGNFGADYRDNSD